MATASTRPPGPATSFTSDTAASSSSSSASTSTLRSPPAVVSVPHYAPRAATHGLTLTLVDEVQQSYPSGSNSTGSDFEAISGFSVTSASSSAQTSYPSVQRTRRPPSSADHDDQTTHTAQASSRKSRFRRSQSRHSPFPPIMVANSINVTLAIVPSAPPPPATAPPLTLSYRAGIDPKTIFVEESQHMQCEQQRRAWKSMGWRREATAAAGVAGSTMGGGRKGHKSTSGTVTPSSIRTQTTSDALTLETTTPASTLPATPLSPSLKSDLSATLDPRQDASIPDSTTPTPATQNRTPTLPAWSQPRPWARLASKDTGAMSFMMPASSAPSEADGPSTPSTSASAVAVPTSSTINGRAPSQQQHQQHQHSRSWQRQPRLSLEALLADAHTQFTAPLTLPRGLINKGNFCFANAIMQVLVFCAPFYNLFTKVGEEISADFANATPLMEAVVHFLREFHLAERPRGGRSGASELAPNPQLSEPLVPEYVYEAMKLNKRFDLMRRGHQEDAEEFLGFFLDTLHEELLSAIQRSNARIAAQQKKSGAGSKRAAAGNTNAATSSDDAPVGEDDVEIEEEREVQRPASPSEEGWMEVGQKGKTAFTRTTSNAESPITRMFGGKLRSVLRTPGAKDSVTLEPYQPLQLDIQPPHVHTIEDALLNLTVPETIPGVYSPARGGLVDATKQVFIERTPPILVLHLKRFLYDEVGGVQKNVKEVGYADTLDIGGEMVSPTRRGEGPTRYRLFGVVYHHGRYASGGHYTVDVLRQDGSGWIHFDDTTFGPVASEHVGRKAGQTLRGNGGHDGLAYLLFYKRQGLDVGVNGEVAHAIANGATTSASQSRASSRGPALGHANAKSSSSSASAAANGHIRLSSEGSNVAHNGSGSAGNRSRTTTAASGASGDGSSPRPAKKSGDKQSQQGQGQGQGGEGEAAAVRPAPKRVVPGAAPPSMKSGGGSAGKGAKAV